ncbi:MAG TPA: type III-B CRISPR module RAMP protein Cmr4, partial [Candidatus Aenigmarchaeota archaeon]|nr:type III-B CRISPR module RAMP protein Cmr4 [Candidatus Aenigmarchaeota archaeon]
MFEKALIMYIYAETPIHPGSGSVISRAVDLPIQRERHTEFPIIQGSSLKGVLRNFACWVEIDEKCKQCNKNPETAEKCEKIRKIFGSPEGVGGISITDAKILAFPVRTLKGVFRWITCPLVLDRYRRDLKLVGVQVKWDIPKPKSDEEAKIHKNSNLAEQYIYIEELQLKCSEDENVNKIAKDIKKGLPKDNAYKEIKEKLEKDLVIVSDDVFRNLVTLTTEIFTRIKIDPSTGTVEKGGLWSEEYLPTDTLMYSLILIPSKLNNIELKEIKERIMN